MIDSVNGTRMGVLKSVQLQLRHYKTTAGVGVHCCSLDLSDLYILFGALMFSFQKHRKG